MPIYTVFAHFTNLWMDVFLNERICFLSVSW